MWWLALSPLYFFQETIISKLPRWPDVCCHYHGHQTWDISGQIALLWISNSIYFSISWRCKLEEFIKICQAERESHHVSILMWDISGEPGEASPPLDCWLSVSQQDNLSLYLPISQPARSQPELYNKFDIAKPLDHITPINLIPLSFYPLTTFHHPHICLSEIIKLHSLHIRQSTSEQINSILFP